MKIPGVSALLFCCFASTTASAQADAAALYQVNCASCHGKTGLGDGPNKVYPPPRNFREGGFSFGNTEEAIFRTITQGIPGTAMTSFAASLTPEERHLLARYVRSLIPEEKRRVPEARRMVVGDRAAIVRGYLPPLPGEEENLPRGLVCGLPGGFSLVFRYDDLRLLEIRRGAFVDRTDWSGRGGTPLRLLGRTFHREEGGRPRPPFSLFGAYGRRPLKVRLQATTAGGKVARLESSLALGKGDELLLEETQKVPQVRGATGVSRRMVLKGAPRAIRLAFRALAFPEDALWEDGRPRSFEALGPLGLSEPLDLPAFFAVRRSNGEWILVHLDGPPGTRLLDEPREVHLALDLPPGRDVVVTVTLLHAPRWTEEVKDNLESDMELVW